MSDTLEYGFESSGLAGVAMVVERATVVEALNEPYVIELDLTVENADADFVQMLGSDGVLTIERGTLMRRFCGIVRDVVEGQHADGALRHVRLRIVPALWALSKRRNTRMFQELTVPEILEDVLGAGLGDYGRSVTISLDATYPRREHCLQYQETDLDFVHRLMEEEGISYAFDHEGDTEVLVLRDRNGAFSRVTSLGDPLEYHQNDLYVRDREPIIAWRHLHRHTTTSVALRDWDWTKSGDMVVADAQAGADALGRDRESYEHGHGRSLTISSYDQGARRYQEQDAARQKGVRREGLVMNALASFGASRVIGLAPGTTFQLVGHPTVGVDGEYLVTRVVHEDQPPVGQAERYQNRFECIPLAVSYRPQRRTKKPYVDGIQTAVVTGPAGEEIHVDEHGRIKVHFHWDRENEPDELSSCWIRVQQTWGGAAWGSWWVPRIGMEVIVQFVDGDPDRPLVTGAVYNGSNATPYALPAEKTKSTIKSNSSLGGGGFNEFRYEDMAGSEEIYTHAQKDYNEVVENDHNTLVHNNQTNTVDVDQTQEIGANQTETVHANQVMTVDGNRTVHVKSNFDETVDATETRHVAGNVTETFDANETRTISGNLTETISGNETRNVSGGQTETISGSQSVTVSGGSSATSTVSGSLTQTVTGGITVTTPAAYSLTAVGGLSVTAAAGIKLVAPGGVQVAAPGGIKQVDNFYTWEGAKKLDLAGMSSSIMGVSIGATGVSIGGTGVSIGYTDVSCGNVGIETEQSIAHLKNAATKMYQIAAWVQMSGILNYF